MPKSDTVAETVQLPRMLVTRLRLIRAAMEERLGRPFTMDEMYRHIVEDFLNKMGPQ